PKGTDTVPAMLTPGENVVNAEASRLPGVQMKVSIRTELTRTNDMGRAIQKKQGGPIPSYKQEGGFVIDDAMLDAIRQVESGGDVNAVSEVGASGPYQIMKATALKPGYGVTPIGLDERFDPEKSRAFAKQYLEGIMRANPDFTKDEVITAYHSGVGNVRKAKMNQEELGPRGQEYAGKVNAEMGDVPVQTTMNENEVPMPMSRPVVYDSTPMESGFMSAQASTGDKEVPEVDPVGC
ncbi:lytic transglycosylase domain-containing protein, partial [Litoreibacter sp.]|nr:lytic transglycosylase domain-containing protein [Litoreibacter sp.]